MNTAEIPTAHPDMETPGRGARSGFRLLTLLFFMWGFITVMNDVLNNSVKEVFQLNPIQRSLIQFAFFGTYFVISLLYYLSSSLSGRDPINRYGYRTGIFFSLGICAAGCFAFYPAALAGSYGLFLAALVILASGVTLLQICANPYAAIMGPSESAASRLNLAQGLNSLGTALAPVCGLILMNRVFSQGNPTAESISLAYLLFGCGFAALALLVRWSRLPEYRTGNKPPGFLSFRANRGLFLGAGAIFCYVGAEVSVGNWIVDLLRHLAPSGPMHDDAGFVLSYFWGGLMIGRVMANFAFDSGMSRKKRIRSMLVASLLLFGLMILLSGLRWEKGLEFHAPVADMWLAYALLLLLQFLAFVTGGVNPARSLAVFCLLLMALLVMVITAPPSVAYWAATGTGLFFSIGWSTIFTLAIRGLGPHTAAGSSILIMAVCGGAIFPMLQAWVYHHPDMGIRQSFAVPLSAVLAILAYALHALRNNHSASS